MRLCQVCTHSDTTNQTTMYYIVKLYVLTLRLKFMMLIINKFVSAVYNTVPYC